jgi:AAHS family 4-hydroxybenzoate transporter-like MFS transporter
MPRPTIVMTNAPPSAPVVRVADVIDASPVGSLQIGTFALCLLCLIIDGFDVQALGYTAPAIIREWNVPNAALGPVFGFGNFGVLLGALGFSMLADTIGRRPVLIGATIFFGVMTLFTARASSVQELLLLRFISGIGLGGIIPQATALVGEYSPKRSRVTLMMGITVGFTAGAAIGGFIAAWLIPAFGWRSVFYVGGAVPLVIAAAMFYRLPESLQFLVLRQRNSEAVRRWLQRIAPGTPLDSARYVVDEEHHGGVPVVHLFREGRALVTILLWVVNFMNLLNLYSLSSWLPTVVRDAGYATSTAVLVGTILQVGGTIGTFGLAWLIARQGFVPMLAASFAVATISIALIGQPGLSLAALIAVVFVAGWCVVGSQPGINALAATYYPTYLRSTGVGWGLGIGRIGAIVGPILGGEFMRLRWSTEEIFYAAALPAAISAMVMFSLRWLIADRRV